MHCNNCGAKLPENETKCPACGTDNAALVVEPEAASQKTEAGRFSNKRNIITIVLAAAALLGVGAGAAVVANQGTSTTQSALKLAQRYLSEQNYEQAIIEFERVLEIDPMNTEAYLGLADAYIALGDTDSAVEVLKKGFELTGDKDIAAKLEEITGGIEPLHTDVTTIPEQPTAYDFTTVQTTVSESAAGIGAVDEIFVGTFEGTDSEREEPPAETTSGSVATTASNAENNTPAVTTRVTTTRGTTTAATTESNPTPAEEAEETPVVLTSGDFEYSLNSGAITITQYTGTARNIIIPETIDGAKVAAIGKFAFKNSDITQVQLPSGLTEIYNEAFRDCKSLKQVNIPAGLTYAGTSAGQFTSGVFYDCDALETVTFDSGIKTITKGLFYGCTGIKHIELPDTVTLIEESAFRSCENLTSIKLSNSLTTIERFAFKNTGLVEVQLPSSLTTISNEAFSDCKLLKKVNIPAGLAFDGYSIGTDASGAFYDCGALETVTFDSGIKTITEGLFYGCTGLKSIELPDTVTLIEQSAFKDCANLTSIKLSNSLATIEKFAFKNSGLTEVQLPSSLTIIQTNAFMDCKSLKKVNIPAGLTYDGPSDGTNRSGVFYGCDALTSVAFDSGITRITSSLLYGCTGLKSIEIPDTVTYIGMGAFRECTGLTSIRLPSSLTEIDKYAFQESGITSITIPSSVTSIGKYAFDDCASITVSAGGKTYTSANMDELYTDFKG
ncbi:MAG: leucine-rich repeat protein [Oscillospiraceae bacterium]